MYFYQDQANILSAYDRINNVWYGRNRENMKAHQGLDDVAYQLSGFASTHFTRTKSNPNKLVMVYWPIPLLPIVVGSGAFGLLYNMIPGFAAAVLLEEVLRLWGDYWKCYA